MPNEPVKHTLVHPTGLVANLTVKSDYDGYFEALFRSWFKRTAIPKHSEFVITAGPYRQDVVSYASKDGVMALDFYSAFRVGFGQLSEAEVHEIIGLM